MATAVLEPLRELGYRTLVERFLAKPDSVEVTASTGVAYQVEIEAVWDSPRNPGPLRLMATADDFGRASVTRDFVTVPDGSFVGEIMIFTLDGHDIVGFTSVAEAAGAWEAIDAPGMEYIGADGAVYAVTVEGSGMGRVHVGATDENRLDYLLSRLRSAAVAGGLLAEDLPRDPRLLWDARGRPGNRRWGWRR